MSTSVCQISSHFCVSQQSIYNIIKKNRFKHILEERKKKKKEEVSELSRSGMTGKEISKKLRISKSTAYRLKTKKAKKFSEWAMRKFLQIDEISDKYQNILSLDGFFIDSSDISSILLDLLIHTDKKNISNKEAYFLKYAPLKISNEKSKIIKQQSKLQDTISGFYSSPEDILIARESIAIKP